MCEVLATTPNELLGFGAAPSDESPAAILRARVSSAAATMDEATLRQAVKALDALADDKDVASQA
jgi:hypothetical protein